MISPSHTDVGVGVAESNGVIYYTMDVGYIAGAAGQGSVSRESSSSGAADASGSSDSALIIPVSSATPQADCSIIHTVKEGQALWNIAAIYNISITDLLALNGLTENSFILPGDELLVRVATTVTATQTITATEGLQPQSKLILRPLSP
jgi:LysM repeat protein